MRLSVFIDESIKIVKDDYDRNIPVQLGDELKIEEIIISQIKEISGIKNIMLSTNRLDDLYWEIEYINSIKKFHVKRYKKECQFSVRAVDQIIEV